MKKYISTILTLAAIILCGSSCNQGNTANKNGIATDSATITIGKTLFEKNCNSCHSFEKGGIGPRLNGLTTQTSAGWIAQFIRDPKKIIESGDERALQLFNKYKITMPSFSAFSDDELKAVVAYINTYDKQDISAGKNDGKGLANPIPDTIALSNLVVGLKLIAQLPATSKDGKLPLTRITKLDFEPHSGVPFILDLRGKLYKMQNNQPSVYMDMARLKPALVDEPGLGTGFGSFAFHPDFAKNGLLYTAHSEVPGSGKADFTFPDSIKVALQYVLTEWKTDHPGDAVFSGKPRELLRVDMPHIIHGIQEIAFNPFAKPGSTDYGILYVCMGDGGCVEKGHPFLTGSPEKIWGTILRIAPTGSNSTNGRYGIPADNPFIHQNKKLGEIYATGFKNPHRITWSKAGQILVSNIGEGNIESVNLIEPGRNYGWPTREGTFVLDPYGDINKVYLLPLNDSSYHFTYPVAQYDHDGGWSAICGGYEYTGTAIPQLTGKFLFGDVASGRLFYIAMADIKQGKRATIKEWRFTINDTKTTFKELAGNDLRVDMHFGRDAQGELYILTKPDGRVYKLVSATIGK